MRNQRAITSSLNCGQSYNIPAGYHNDSGKVIANNLTSQTVNTATAWVNGDKIIGNGTHMNNAHNNRYNQGKQDTESLHAITPYCYFYVIETKGSVEATLFSQVPSTSLSDFEKSLHLIFRIIIK